MNKIKDFFILLWYYITYPFDWISTRKVRKKLEEAGAEWRASLITEKDVEFLRSIGVETTLEELRNGEKKERKAKNPKILLSKK